MYMPHIETNGKPFTNFAEILEQGAADQMNSLRAAIPERCSELGS